MRFLFGERLLLRLFSEGWGGGIKTLQISSQVEAIIHSWTVCMFKKMSPFCTVAETITLYLETRASLCVYFTFVCMCMSEGAHVCVCGSLAKYTDVVIRANISLFLDFLPPSG